MPESPIADTLQRLGKPILMLDTTKAGHFDETSGPADIQENHGIHGVMDLASVLTGRRCRSRWWRAVSRCETAVPCGWRCAR